MDYPIEAFEISLDPSTNEEYIRIKSAYKVRKNKVKAKKTKKTTKSNKYFLIPLDFFFIILISSCYV
jgi:hypothetical protein